MIFDLTGKNMLPGLLESLNNAKVHTIKNEIELKFTIVTTVV